jgi:hypothetical protein
MVSVNLFLFISTGDEYFHAVTSVNVKVIQFNKALDTDFGAGVKDWTVVCVLRFRHSGQGRDIPGAKDAHWAAYD